ncbi:hypothetical protein [uncultured Jatrophihabitans sp.]
MKKSWRLREELIAPARAGRGSGRRRGVDFCRLVSYRGTGTGLLTTFVPF